MRHAHRILTRQKDMFTHTLALTPRDVEMFEYIFYNLDRIAARIPRQAEHLLEDLPQGELYAPLEALRVRIGMCSQYEHTHYLPVTQDDLARLLQIFVLLAQDMRSVTDYRRQYTVGENGLREDYARLYQKLRHAAYGSSHMPLTALFGTFEHDIEGVLAHAEQFPTYADTILALRIYTELSVIKNGSLDRLLVEDLVRLAASAESGKHPSDLIESDLYATDYLGQEPGVPWANHILKEMSRTVINEGIDVFITESTFLKEADIDPRYRVSQFARPNVKGLPKHIAEKFERQDYGLGDDQ